MATLDDLSRKFNAIRKECSRAIPNALGRDMLEETKQNFADEAYGNDGVKRRWPDRRFEKWLNYPKLDYKGKLKRSFKYSILRLSSKSVNVILSSSSPYAQIQQEGLQGSGNPVRRPPYSTKTLKLGTKPLARKFMGIGKRSVLQFRETISRHLRKVMSNL